MRRAASLMVVGAAGALLGAGLIVGGMTQPAKVMGFLDVTHKWDPTLLFVMLGALAIYVPWSHRVLRRGVTVYGKALEAPALRAVDTRLVLGAALFGVGWGLAGICPGPALTSAGSLAPQSWVFLGAMWLGFLLERRYVRGFSPSTGSVSLACGDAETRVASLPESAG